MHPYREPGRAPEPELPAGMPSEERFLIGLLVVIGGVRVLAGILVGKPWGAEMTIGFFGLVLGLWSGLRRPWRGLWRRHRGPGKLHDRDDRDRAPRG